MLICVRPVFSLQPRFCSAKPEASANWAHGRRAAQYKDQLRHRRSSPAASLMTGKNGLLRAYYAVDKLESWPYEGHTYPV